MLDVRELSSPQHAPHRDIPILRGAGEGAGKRVDLEGAVGKAAKREGG
jgi:hypothetical protein